MGSGQSRLSGEQQVVQTHQALIEGLTSMQRLNVCLARAAGSSPVTFRGP